MQLIAEARNSPQHLTLNTSQLDALIWALTHGFSPHGEDKATVALILSDQGPAHFEVQSHPEKGLNQIIFLKDHVDWSKIEDWQDLESDTDIVRIRLEKSILPKKSSLDKAREWLHAKIKSLCTATFI